MGLWLIFNHIWFTNDFAFFSISISIFHFSFTSSDMLRLNVQTIVFPEKKKKKKKKKKNMQSRLSLAEKRSGIVEIIWFVYGFAFSPYIEKKIIPNPSGIAHFFDTLTSFPPSFSLLLEKDNFTCPNSLIPMWSNFQLAPNYSKLLVLLSLATIFLLRLINLWKNAHDTPQLRDKF